MSTTVGTRFDRFQMALFSILEYVVTKLCSKHGKRVMFISSLYVQVTQLERLKAEVVHKLNSVMGLTTREDAVHFPAAISDIVWRGTKVGKLLQQELGGQPVNEQRAREVSAKVVDICPRLIRYGTRNEMEQDVTTLILSVGDLAAAA